jgi:hypothetical protein
LDSDKNYRRAAFFAPALFGLIAFAAIAQRPGLHYDEALPAMPAVHLSRASGPPTYPHDAGTWLCVGARCLPLMNLRYVGAVKDLLYLPIWGAAGPSVEAFRLLGMLFGAVGVAGAAALLARFAGWRAAGIGSLALAANPAYVQQTVFDSGLIAGWMLAFGLLCFAVTAFAKRPDATRALLLGAACGFGIWCRANFLWLLIAILFAVAAVARREIARHMDKAIPFVLGGLAGGFPFLLYQAISRGGTVQALSMYPAAGRLSEVLPARLVLMAETLLSDREHRVMWGDAQIPPWQAIPIAALAVLAIAVCFRRGVFGRCVALTALAFTAILLTSRMAIGEHHLIAVAPLVAMAAGIAVAPVRARFRVPALIVYGGLALFWNGLTTLGLADSGGKDHWSNASYRLAESLERLDRETVFVDWGLHNQIYFLTRGKLRAREIFGDETRAETGESWDALVAPGRLFVTNGEGHRAFAGPTEGVRRAIAGRPNARRIGLPQHDGQIYAEVLFDDNR